MELCRFDILTNKLIIKKNVENTPSNRTCLEKELSSCGQEHDEKIKELVEEKDNLQHFQQYLKPLNCGWKREIVFRSIINGVSAKDSKGRHADVYYYSPTGKKLRSTPSILSFLALNGVKQQEKLLALNFTFIGRKISNHPNEWYRNAKEKTPSDTPRPISGVKKIKKITISSDVVTTVIKTPVKGRGRPRKTPEKCQSSKIEGELIASAASMIPADESFSKFADIKNTGDNEGSLCMTCENDEDDGNESPDRKRASRAEPLQKSSPLLKDVKRKAASKQKIKRSIPIKGKLCNFNCPGLEKVCPNLQCTKCFCLFHPECVEVDQSTSKDVDYVCQICRGSESTPSNIAREKSTNSKKSVDVFLNNLKNLSKVCGPAVEALRKASSPDGLFGDDSSISKTNTITITTSVQQQKVISTTKSSSAVVESPFTFARSVNNLVIPIGDCYNTNNATTYPGTACYMLPQTPQIVPYGYNTNLGMFPTLPSVNTFNSPAALPNIFLSNNSASVFPQSVIPNQQLNFQFNLPSPLLHFGPATAFPIHPSRMQGQFSSTDLVYPQMPVLTPVVTLSSTQPSYNHFVSRAPAVSRDHQVKSKDLTKSLPGSCKTINHLNVSSKETSDANRGSNADSPPTLLPCISSAGSSSQKDASFDEFSSSSLVGTNLTSSSQLSSDSLVNRTPLPVFIYDFSTRLESTISSNGVVTKIICPEPISVSGQGADEWTGKGADLAGDHNDVDQSNDLNSSRCVETSLIGSCDKEIVLTSPRGTDDVDICHRVSEITDRVDSLSPLSPSSLMVTTAKQGKDDKNNHQNKRSAYHIKEKNDLNKTNSDRHHIPDSDDVTADGSLNGSANDKRVDDKNSGATDNPGVITNMNDFPTCNDHSKSNPFIDEADECRSKTPIGRCRQADECFESVEEGGTVSREATAVDSMPSLSPSPFIETLSSSPQVESMSPGLRSTSPGLRSTSPEVRSTSPEVRSTSPEESFRFQNDLFLNKEDCFTVQLLEHFKQSVLDFTEVDLTSKQIYYSFVNIFTSSTNFSHISTLHLKFCPLHLLELISIHLWNLVQLTLAVESSPVESYISLLASFKHLKTLKIEKETSSSDGGLTDFRPKNFGDVGRTCEVCDEVSCDHRSNAVRENRSNFSELRELHINESGCVYLTESILSCQFDKLTRLNVTSCDGWSKETYGLLGRLVQLTSLELCSGGGIPDVGLSSSLPKLENLLELKLHKFVVDWSLSSCIQKMSRLKVLHVAPRTEHKGVNEAGYINLCCMFAMWNLNNLSELTWIAPACSSNSLCHLPFLMADASRLKSRSGQVSESAGLKNSEEKCLMLSVKDLKLKLQSSLPNTCVNVQIA